MMSVASLPSRTLSNVSISAVAVAPEADVIPEPVSKWLVVSESTVIFTAPAITRYELVSFHGLMQTGDLNVSFYW